MIQNFNKYKRLFTFGCSFTSHHYPTWANVIFKEMTDCEFYNFGRSGAGNLCIASKISEAAGKFEFNENDLVMVMYSSFSREDRYINGTWQSHGNVFNNHYYDEEFVKNYCDPVGYFVRDGALINLTNKFLESLSCDSIKMLSYDMSYVEGTYYYNDEKTYYAKNQENIVNFYKQVLDTMPIAFWTYYNNRNDLGHAYWHPSFNHVHGDSHPGPKYWYNYLKQIGLPMTDKSEKYAYESHCKLKDCKTLEDILKAFDEEDKLRSKHQNHLF